MRNLLIFACLVAFTTLGIHTACGKEADDEKSTAKKKITLAAIKISGPFPETETQIGLFGELEQSLAKTIARIEKASEDDQLAGLILRLRRLIALTR